MPDRVPAPPDFLLLTLELPVILLAMMVTGGTTAGLFLRAALTVALTAVFILKIADIAMYQAFGRSFDPVSDLPLVAAALNLISGTFGTVTSIGAALLAVLMAALLAWSIWWATGTWAAFNLASRGRVIAAAALMATGLAAVADTLRPDAVPGSAGASRYAAESLTQAQHTLAGLREFSRAAKYDVFAGDDPMLDAIDRDVLVIFVESYGRASLDTPFFAETHRATLDAATARLSALGLSMRSAYLSAPTRGGQSWLSHATFANGLRVDDQSRYRALLASHRASLFHIARRSGFRTATVAPAITMPWPEAAFMGFDTILAAKDLGYRGKPFNWVTMPDQFTLTALDRLLRSGTDPRPLFAEVALISSHAPWVPVPDLLGWDALGDGKVFDEMATSGDPPKVVWSDPERVRTQYRLALDYSLRTIFDYAARQADNPPLMIVLGDHQTSATIAGDERPHVPIHVIGPPGLVARTDTWGWADGLVPAPDPVIPMERMRDMILRAFTTGPAPGDTG
nr:sulfatase-like hydrolase/transferase [Tropicimonas marinistellae]